MCIRDRYQRRVRGICARAMASKASYTDGSSNKAKFDNTEKNDCRSRNIVAAKAIADCVRTSLGPRGMDKMVIDAKQDVVITNDGATILKKLQVQSPAARMLVDLSKAQDIEAGDGTTTVVVIAGSLLESARELLNKLHPNVISRSFRMAADQCVKVLDSMSKPIAEDDYDMMIKICSTALNSKVISGHSNTLAPMAVSAVQAVTVPGTTNCDLDDIKVIKCYGGTIDDSERVNGIVFPKKASHFAEGPTRIENAKIGLIQFCISPPKTDMENNVVVSDYGHMDRILREEKAYILKIVKAIKTAGINVLLIQKSILRTAVNDLALHFLAKLKIMVIRDIERDEIEFISKATGCIPMASVDALHPEKLGRAELVQEVAVGMGKVVKVTGIENMGRVATVLLRGSNKMLLDEVERSFHDALCVARCLVKKRFLICGGGAPEIEMAIQLEAYAKTLQGQESYCIRRFAEALEIIPYTLAENAGLQPMEIVTDLRNKHTQGMRHQGINVRKGCVTDMMEEDVVQPLLVDTSAISLATEACRAILKIDDIVPTR
eukprot:TRINITY_DN2553_c0_g1_i3.p1 TRINITY_DN2553_c0_g1~~TRINITY_DN2553_c0_g1_i3.p1  ORF type:complete len:549 (-),score=197.81 TRINITY_DN2553_c0_g1_i3:124-1770(-)